MSNSDRPKVLVVDDQKENIDILTNLLSADYRVQIALSGEKAIKIAQKNPDLELIFLDVMMPQMDGYETCRRLKQNPDTIGMDVIFVSAMSEESQIVAGYEAGGIDYVVKPIRPEELQQKARLAIDNRRIRQDVEREKASALDLAMMAMTSSGELGVVVNFLRSSIAANDCEDLGHTLVESVSAYGLDSVAQLRTYREIVTVGSQGPVPPLEKEFLMVLKDAGRLREKRDLFIANYGNLTLLVKNMPEDEEKRGRMRDNLALLAEGADSRRAALELEQETVKTLDSAKQSLQDIERKGSKQKQQAETIMQDLMQELEESFMTYGLNEEQETLLMQMVERSAARTLHNIELGVSIDNEMREIISNLETALTRKP